MKKRLYVCDLDGTLLDKPFSPIPEKLFPLIRLMHENGISFAAATGRQPGNVRKLFDGVKGLIYLISDNGGTLYEWDKLIRHDVMQEGREEELIDDIRKTPGVYLEMTGLTTGFMTEEGKPLREFMERGIHVEQVLKDPHVRPEPVTKISMNEFGHPRVSPETVRFFHEKYDDLYSVVESGNGWLDVYPKRSGKGPALKFLIERLGLVRGEVVVFGDNENDVSMFQEAGLSYARDHSLRHVKDAADRVTDDPVAEIEKLLTEDLS